MGNTGPCTSLITGPTRAWRFFNLQIRTLSRALCPVTGTSLAVLGNPKRAIPRYTKINIFSLSVLRSLWHNRSREANMGMLVNFWFRESKVRRIKSVV